MAASTGPDRGEPSAFERRGYSPPTLPAWHVMTSLPDRVVTLVLRTEDEVLGSLSPFAVASLYWQDSRR
jgi:hypothetical protein